MINQKELQGLDKMWNSASGGGADIPEGKYEMVIVKAKAGISGGGKPYVKAEAKIVGGNEELVGHKVDMLDNLETADNMGWFKKKLARLRINLPSTFAEVMDEGPEGVCARMVGKKFQAQVVYKNEFMNVYVNRLIGEVEVESQPELPMTESTEAAEETIEETPAEQIEKGDIVKYASATLNVEGEVLELCAAPDHGKARVRDEATGKVYKLLVEKLEPVYDETPEEEAAEEPKVEEDATEEAEPAAETEEAEATEEAPKAKTNGNGKKKFPKPEDVKKLAMPGLKTLLKDHGLDIAKIKDPRGFAEGIAGFLHVRDYKPGITMLAPLCAGLGLAYQKGAKPAIVVQTLGKKVKEAFA